MNIPKHIQDKIGRNLHLPPESQTGPQHPLAIVYQEICQLFPSFSIFDSLSPKVAISNNFDVLRIPPEHPSRSLSDTYYYDSETVLRTHTSAHQVPLLKAGIQSFLVCGDVYRKDDIDATHYPVFHQLEGVHLCDNPEQDLHATLSKLIKHLFNAEFRFKDDYFPFTHPSWEVEVFFEGKWLEILGCGVIHPEVLANAGIKNRTGWAFGLGLERLAMILFKIPDIRLFWSEDPRFLSQFQAGKQSVFIPYSKYPVCYKDIAFWTTLQFCEKEMFDIIRNVGGDLIESVKLVDTFKKGEKTSLCYRINYCDNSRSLTNEEINQLHNQLRTLLPEKFGVEVR